MDLCKSDCLAILEFIQSCVVSENSRGDLDRIFHRLQRLVPFDSAIIGSGGVRGGQIDSVLDIYSYGRNLWIEEYRKCQLERVDPIVLRGLRDARPFRWSEALAFHPCRAREYLDLKGSFDLTDGMAAACRARRDQTRTTLVSLAVPEKTIPRRHLAIFEHVLHHINELYLRTPAGRATPAAPGLTSRELEILRWIKEGKSSWDIGMLLSISERTVKFHLTNLFAKLDVSNRAQAVARAMRLGLLEL